MAKERVSEVLDRMIPPTDPPGLHAAAEALKEAEAAFATAHAEYEHVLNLVDPNRRPMATIDEEELPRAQERQAEVTRTHATARLPLLDARRTHEALVTAHRDRLRAARHPTEVALRVADYRKAVEHAETHRALLAHVEQSIALKVSPNGDLDLFFANQFADESLLAAMRADLRARGIKIDEA